jgi:hypothetical protein
MLTCPSARGLSIDTTLALLLVRKEAGEDVIDLSEMSLQQADEDVRTGHIGTALIKRQFEQYKYKDLTTDELQDIRGGKLRWDCIRQPVTRSRVAGGSRVGQHSVVQVTQAMPQLGFYGRASRVFPVAPRLVGSDPTLSRCPHQLQRC